MKRRGLVAPVVVGTLLGAGLTYGTHELVEYSAAQRQGQQKEQRITDARQALAVGYTGCRIVSVQNEGPSAHGTPSEHRTRLAVALQLTSSGDANAAMRDSRNQGYISRQNTLHAAVPYIKDKKQLASNLARGAGLEIMNPNYDLLPDNGATTTEIDPQGIYKDGTKAIIYAARDTYMDPHHDAVSGTYCGTVIAQAQPGGGVTWSVDPNPPAWPNVHMTVKE